MEIINQFKAGDIVLVYIKTPIAKLIEWVMKLDRKRRGIPVPNGHVANHAGMLVYLWGELYIAQAMEKGVEIKPFINEFKGKFNRVKVLSPKKPYSNAEQDKISRVAIQSALDPTRYDFFGLWYGLKYILSNKKKWDGPRGDKALSRMYCTEAIATWANKVRPRTFDIQEATNPLDIELNRYYKVIYDGSEIE